MRNLFLVLLLANIGAAAWQYGSGRDAEPGPRADAPPDILLTRERPVPAATAAAPDANGDTGSEPAASRTGGRTAPPEAIAPTTAECVSIGPFEELSQAAAAAATLRADGFDPSQRVAEGDIWVGYWVYVEDLATVDDAEAAAEDLREAGITDAYVIPNTDSGHLVSLGVFSEVARAGSRSDQARAEGYTVTVTDRTRRGNVYWIDTQLGPQQSLGFEQLQPQGRIIRLEQRPCPAGAGANG